jgi:hypothetical protein
MDFLGRMVNILMLKTIDFMASFLFFFTIELILLFFNGFFLSNKCNLKMNDD